MSVSHCFGTEFPLNVLEMATSRDTHTHTVTLGSSSGSIVAWFAPLVGFLCTCHTLLFIYMPARPPLLLLPLPPSPLPFKFDSELREFQSTCYYSFRPISTNEPYSVHRLPSIYRPAQLAHTHSSLARSSVFLMRNWREWEEYTISM